MKDTLVIWHTRLAKVLLRREKKAWWDRLNWFGTVVTTANMDLGIEKYTQESRRIIRADFRDLCRGVEAFWGVVDGEMIVKESDASVVRRAAVRRYVVFRLCVCNGIACR